MESTLFLKKHPGLFNENTFIHVHNTRCQNDLRINAGCLAVTFKSPINIVITIKCLWKLKVRKRSPKEKTEILFIDFKSL